MFAVVSWPAISRITARSTSSSTVVSPLTSRVAISSSSSPSPGSVRFRRIRLSRYVSSRRRASSTSAGSGPRSSRRDCPSKNSWSAYGTPSREQITMDGTGRAKELTSSVRVPRATIVSISRSTVSWICGRMAAVRLTEKLGISIRRCRLCSGSSTPSRAARRLWMPLKRRVGAGKASLVRSLDSRASASRARASAWPVTTHTERPSKRLTRERGGSPAAARTRWVGGRGRCGPGGRRRHPAGHGTWPRSWKTTPRKRWFRSRRTPLHA